MPELPATPNEPSTPALPPRRARAGDTAVHGGSGKFYTITANDGESVSYVRLVDNADYKLAEVDFYHRFRPATEAELVALNAMLPVFVAEGVVPDVRNVMLRYLASQQAVSQTDATPDTMELMLERRGRRETVEVGLLVEPSATDTLENLILHDDTMTDVKLGLSVIQNRAALAAIFGIDLIQPKGNKTVINFHGMPGTGKTRCALAVAKHLGKNLYQVDYAAMISKYVGDTAKHIAAAFAKATELNAVLYWDEADSLCSRRLNTDEAGSVSINQNRNVLMQELDRFDGIVIMSTNFVSNFDPAIVRRIARNVEFQLPDMQMRAKIYALHFPVMDKVQVTDGFTTVAKASEGFSGGDILNVALNSMQRAVLCGLPETWAITEVDILTEAVSIHRTKLASGNKVEIEKHDLKERLRRAQVILNKATGASVDVADDTDGDDDMPKFDFTNG
jgi:hypothetical protein